MVPRFAAEPDVDRDGGSTPSLASAREWLVWAPSFLLVAVGLWVAIVTEVLSAFRLLTPGMIRVAWALMAGLAVLGLRGRLGELRRGVSLLVGEWTGQDPMVKAIAAGLAVIAAVSLLLAVVSPPNNWDSMEYHNARVLQWLDHGSVEHYPTGIERQLRMPPLSSYFKLHAFALTGNDILFGSVQWVGYVLVILQTFILGWRVARSVLVAALSAAFAGTLPMAVLQSSSTQNDLITAAYMVTALVALTEILEIGAGGWLRGALRTFWLSIALGCLVKGTFYIYGAVIATWLLTALVVQGRKRLLLSVLWGSALVGLINGPHWTRNFFHFGQPAPSFESVQLGALAAAPLEIPSKVLSQLARAAVGQFDVLGYNREAQLGMDSLVLSFDRWLGLPAFDPALSGYPFRSTYFLVHENFAGNPLHVLIILIATVLIPLTPRLRRLRGLIPLLGVAWSCLFAIVVLVKWMPWNGRLQMPALVLFAVPVCWALVEVLEDAGKTAKSRLSLALFCGLLFSWTLPYLLFNQTKPLLWPVRTGDAPKTSILQSSRWDNFFRAKPWIQQDLEAAVDALPAECASSPVGLDFSEGTWEYPLWLRARERFGKWVSLEHVIPGASPARYCAIISSQQCPGKAYCRLITYR